MKRLYFIKFSPCIHQITGCQRATLILSTLEYWFQKKQEGFYKFIEPCSHRLYRVGDSWTEELNCDRKSFTSSFDKIAVRYKSRRAYEEAEDKFQEKLYASFYDRNTNQTYFIRNHDLANKALADIFTTKRNVANKECSNAQKPTHSLSSDPLRTGKNSRLYIEAKNTSNNLSKDKSHAKEIVKKMIEIWTALVEEGKNQIELTRKRIAFLKQAFKDKFDNSLEKWTKYCQEIASRKFLMGEKTSWRASLDWALKFANIQKVFDGHYGIADRTLKTILPSPAVLHEEIINSSDDQKIKDFRALCLKTVGNAKYISYFKHLIIEFRGEGGVALIAPHKFAADDLERNCYSYLRLVLQELGENLNSITIFAPGEARGRLVERGGGTASISPPNLITKHTITEEFSAKVSASEDAFYPDTSSESVVFLAELKKSIPPKQFPNWLADMEVEEISSEGALIVTFDDQFKANWCKEHFSQQILQAGKKLWGNVKHLDIQEKWRDSLGTFDEVSCTIDESSLFQQAVQSMMSSGGVGIGKGASPINDQIMF